jgi:hypothetical protein
MKDPWLRGKEGAWIPSPQIQGAYEITVNELMFPNTNVWDKDKIESLFPMHIVNRILDIPLFGMYEKDKVVWASDVHGQYSVKSGYNLLSQSTGKMAGATNHEDWNKLWRIHAPPKAKHLLWRICKGCLPTRVRLQEKCVPCSMNCSLCDHNAEDDWHVLFTCSDSIQARQSAGLEHIIAARIQQFGNVSEVIHDICSTEDTKVAGLFAYLVWMLWKNRNNSVWNNEKELGRSLGIKAR